MIINLKEWKLKIYENFEFEIIITKKFYLPNSNQINIQKYIHKLGFINLNKNRRSFPNIIFTRNTYMYKYRKNQNKKCKWLHYKKDKFAGNLSWQNQNKYLHQFYFQEELNSSWKIAKSHFTRVVSSRIIESLFILSFVGWLINLLYVWR